LNKQKKQAAGHTSAEASGRQGPVLDGQEPIATG